MRLISAGVLAPLTLGCIWAGGALFAGLVTLASIGLAYEWTGLCGQRTVPAAFVFAALPLATLVTALFGPLPALLLLSIATVAAIILVRGFSAFKPLAFGVPYLGLGAVALVWLRHQPTGGGANVIGMLLIVWASDIGAYIVGRTIGGPRLAPRISPGKTWSGAIGGLLGAAAAGYAVSAILGNGPVHLRPTGLAVIIGMISQAGDLFESRLKRHFGVKDSGNLIPGHGGLLDRLDAVLTAAPAAALLALLLGPGVVIWE